MSTTKITKTDLDADGFYKASASLEVEGDIEIESSLGLVQFNGRLSATESIISGAGSGIKAGLGIEAGWGIKAGLGITAGYGIKAGSGIEAGLGIKAGLGITAGYGIKAGSGIEAGLGIKAQFVFSFQFEITAKWLQTSQLPFWRKFWAEMGPLKKWRDEILDEDNCWDDLKPLVAQPEAEQICEWEGWHPILRAHLEMFFGLKKRVELNKSEKENSI